MGRKFFFFDIDGTLTNSNPGGIILPSTFATLDKLRANGHVVAIATGRAECMAKPFAREIGIENMIHDGGNGVTINHEIHHIEPLPKENVQILIHECLEKDIPFCVTLDNSLNRYTHHPISTGDPHMDEFLHIVVKEDLDYDHLGDVFKVVVLLRREEEHRLEALKQIGYSRYEDTIIWVEPDDKVKGIKELVSIMGGSFEDVVVFGDGRNDLSMIKAAPISIAMGNAIDSVKEAATFVTHRNDEDGIEYACKHFGWID